MTLRRHLYLACLGVIDAVPEMTSKYNIALLAPVSSLGLLPICHAALHLLHSKEEIAWAESVRRATVPTLLARLCVDKLHDIAPAHQQKAAEALLRSHRGPVKL